MKNQHQVMWLVALIIGMLSWPQTSLSSEIFKDRFRAPVYLDEIWGQEGRKTWTGEEMEEITDYCYETSIRWGAISNFDINLDDKPDLLLAISCYQPPNPSPNEKHNQQVIGAWRLFCSQPDGSHDDCTEKVFGTKQIRATAATDIGGGNPYIHVMAQPKDLNGDGYPEIWYALNRDDGRPNIDYADPEQVAIGESLCGPTDPNEPLPDCTWKSVQTMLLSNGDGTYQVAELPWGLVYSHAMLAFPNEIGTYDFISLYGGGRFVARLNKDNTFSDITSTAEKNYKNIFVATGMEPYAKALEWDGTYYLAGANVRAGIVNNPDAGEWLEDLNARDHPGFTVWEWKPGVGFELYDFYVPDESDKFVYKEARGDGFEEMPGAYVRGIPVYFPRWHFFEFVQLHPNEEPVLVAWQEANTTFGEYFKAPPDPDAIYQYGVFEAGDYQHRFTHIQAVDGFYLRDGKLVQREKSVIEGDFVWSLPGMRFKDLTGNGLMDMYGHTGGPDRGSIYLNDGSGTLRKLNLRSVVPDVEFIQEQFSWNSGGAMTVRDLGKAPYLSLIYWVIGNGTGHGVNDPAELATWEIGEFTILQAKEPITAVAPESAEAFMNYLGQCVGAWPECDPY